MDYDIHCKVIIEIAIFKCSGRHSDNAGGNMPEDERDREKRGDGLVRTAKRTFKGIVDMNMANSSGRMDHSGEPAKGFIHQQQR